MHDQHHEHRKSKKEQHPQLLLTVIVLFLMVAGFLIFLSSSASQKLLGIQINPLAGLASFSNRPPQDTVVNCVAAPCPWDPTEFTVTSPSANEVWTPGSSYKIAWLSPVMDPSYAAYRVSISLEKVLPECALYTKPSCDPYTPAPYVIASNAENNGLYEWFIPNDISSSYVGDMQIVVKINDTALEARSQTFKLNKAGALQVTSPQAGEHWRMGQSYKILWTPSAQQSSTARKQTVTISLVSPFPVCQDPNVACPMGAPSYQITNSAENIGAYEWTVPSTLSSSYRGQQQIVLTNNSTRESATSVKYFFIDGPTVTGSQPQVVSATMPPAPINQNYAFRFEAKGGQPPYRWSAAVSNNLTGWKMEESTGNFKANISRVGAYTVVITVTDSTGANSMKRFSWQVGTVAIPHPEGSLVQGLDGIPTGVGLIENGKRRPFPTGEVFMSHGYKWENIVPGNKGDQNLPLGQGFTFAPGTLIRPSNSLNSCVVYSGMQYWCFNSNAVMRRMGYTASMAYSVTAEHLAGSGYKQGPALTDITVHAPGTDVKIGDKIYRMTTKGRKVYPTTAIYNTWHTFNNDYSRVVQANDLDMDAPLEAPMVARTAGQ